MAGLNTHDAARAHASGVYYRDVYLCVKICNIGGKQLSTAEELDYYDLGIECFDNLTYGQRISALAIVGNGLLRKDIPELTCDDLEDWETEVQRLSEVIVWEVDYENAQLYIDFSPEKSKRLRDWAGIPDDYFLAIADDLTDQEAQARITELKRLCHSIIERS